MRLAMALTISLLAANVLAVEAKRFVIAAPNATVIDLQRDHFSVAVVSGWVSSDDTFIQQLLSKNDKLVVTSNATVVNFDGQVVDQIAYVYENSDISRNVGRPWGSNKFLINKSPADASNASVDLRLALYKSSNLTTVLNSLSSAAPGATSLLTADWATYSKVAVGLVNSIFGTEKTRYPFVWSGDIKLPDVMALLGMKEHLIVLIAKQKDSDKFLDNLDARKLAYDAAAQQLKYDGKLLTSHTYAVLRVSKESPYDIRQLTYSSEAPWASLAQTNFLAAEPLSVKNRDELLGSVNSRLNDLRNELLLLKKERRFSAFDRAVALRHFATNVKTKATRACTDLAIAQCPIASLEDFIASINDAFGVERHTVAIENDADQLGIALGVASKTDDAESTINPRENGVVRLTSR